MNDSIDINTSLYNLLSQLINNPLIATRYSNRRPLT